MVENLKKIIKNAYTPYSKYNVACILIMTNNHVMGSSKEICKPCFLCRELLVEFFSEEANVYCYNKNGKCEIFKVKDLCPHPFVLEEKHD